MNPHAKFLHQALEIDLLLERLNSDNCKWADALNLNIQNALKQKHGSLDNWINCLKILPEVKNTQLDLSTSKINLSLNKAEQARVAALLIEPLKQLKPWRKGPYSLFGIEIDTEWRSDLKWDRLAPQLDLRGKTVLDVGCANGYFGWRMLGAGAKSVIGIEPSYLYLIQFLLLKHFIKRSKNNEVSHTLLPLKLEDFPAQSHYFDSVFSMGVLYHRRCVFDHLFELKQCLKPGGDLILETLVIPQSEGEVLVPKDRYARMGNVWFIPSSHVLCQWLARVGFIDIRVIDESNTTLDEQRKTPWIDSQSLAEALKPNDLSRTIENYPAPRRAVIMANKP